MTKRSQIPNPRVDRAVLDDIELYTLDLETGKRIKKVVWCEYHEQWEWIADFYKESAKKAKYPNDVRNMCITAWDIVKGKTDFSKLPVSRKSKIPTASLILFLKD